jgi:hypothetical protein
MLFARNDASRVAYQERWEPAVRRTRRAANRRPTNGSGGGVRRAGNRNRGLQAAGLRKARRPATRWASEARLARTQQPVRNGASDPGTILLGRCPTARGSAAGRRAPTIHRRRPAAKPQCQHEAPTAAGSAARVLQNADGQLQPIVRQRHVGMRIRPPEACDGRNPHPLHPAPTPVDRAATQRRRPTESARLEGNHALQTERCARDVDRKRPRGRRAKDDISGEPEEPRLAPAARTEGKSRDAFARDDERCTARAARPAQQDASAAYAVDALPKERPRHARAGGHAEDHATRRKQTSEARIA